VSAALQSTRAILTLISLKLPPSLQARIESSIDRLGLALDNIRIIE